MNNLYLPEYNHTIAQAIESHMGEDDWYEKSLRSVVFSTITDNEQHFRPLNDKCVDSPMAFVESVREAFADIGSFPMYQIGNLCLSFKVLHNIDRGTVRLRMYIYAAHFNLYRIVLPTSDAIAAIRNIIHSYLKFEEEWEARRIKNLRSDII